ncbi:hypothetical protein NMY22_g2714 [Coprinellus aureogranulatus]|nr:hypothetical protein NMY22_g2714 [Coprinellus aureogranulatus]
MARDLELVPRASPQPCPQRYVCPEPRPYPNTPDTGDDPGPGRFKCRIGFSSSDPNFAFCIYEKVSSSLSSKRLNPDSLEQDTGNLVASTPSGVQALCWVSGMPNPECTTLSRRRAIPIRPRLPEPQQPGSPVIMERFAKAKKS